MCELVIVKETGHGGGDTPFLDSVVKSLLVFDGNKVALAEPKVMLVVVVEHHEAVFLLGLVAVGPVCAYFRVLNNLYVVVKI